MHTHNIFGIFCISLLLASTQAHAINFDDMSESQQQKLMGEWKPLQVTGDAIPWNIFALTKEKQHKKTYPDGSYAFSVTPDFPKELIAYKNKHVTLMGYMFPLDANEEQKDFLIGPYPVSCPYHYHTPPSMVVEVLSKEPIPFSYDPLILTGTLSLDYNEEIGVFYYLKDAEIKH